MTRPDNVPAHRWQHVLPLAWRMLRRDARAGELRLLLLALVVAVAAVTSVAFLSGRVGAALERDAARMLGADLVVEAGDAIPPAWLEEAQRRGLSALRVWQFPSMAAAGDAVQLAAVKAVEPGYPLRGELRVAPDVDGTDDAPARDVANAGIPVPGTVWLDAALLTLLNIAVGDALELGDARFQVARVISFEPDRGMQFVNVAPRVLLHADDLLATGLTGAGSRIGHALHVAGDEAAVRDYRQWLAARLQPGQRIADLESGRPEVRRAVDRAQRFLALVALLAVMIAALAIAMAARRYVQRHRDATAVMRCLGATQALVMRVLTVEFAWLALAGSALGCVLGWLAHAGLLAMLAGLITTDLPAAGITPALQGLATGVWLLLGFALPPLAQLRFVPPARVLRRDALNLHTGPRLQSLLVWLAAAAGFVLLLWWVAGEVQLGLVVTAGFLAALAVFAGVTALLLAALARLRSAAPSITLRFGPALRFALAGLARRRAATLAQTCALATGIMALTLLAITRTDLISSWQRSLPADAPNRFVINIQPDQRDAIRARLAETGLGDITLYPMIRGRLLAVNERAVGPDDYAAPRAKRLVDRDFNLSYAERIPPWNRLLAGADLNPDASEVSLEAGLAATLDLTLGDRLRFDVAGSQIDVRVTSIRQVDWDSMQANFFALLTPAALQAFPQSWMTSFHLPDAQSQLTQQLVRDFPNLTVFDVRAILGQVQRVLNQAVAAVQLLFVFTLAAGAVVLAAALSATRDERQHEAALLRALGATRVQLARAQRAELLAAGALAGLLAAAAATTLAWFLATRVFEFAWTWQLWPWPAAITLGALTAWASGALALRGVLYTPPWVTLREG